MYQADWTIVSNLHRILLLRIKVIRAPVQPHKCSAVADAQFEQANHNVSLDHQPCVLVESANKTVWPRDSINGNLLDSVPNFFFSENFLVLQICCLDSQRSQGNCMLSVKYCSEIVYY
jgi:hypothetical protein